ncbi:penicillin-binding protein 2 [Candidatus Berkelbacteria bacterium]|nr:penicillin-binding protein 2 [Candidatus Berkelbacteria bacterium]
MNYELSAHSPHIVRQRLNILVGGVILIAALISWRLLQKGVIEHPLYAAQAENQYEISKELPSRRGTIYAQDYELGRRVPMASTEERFDISVVPRNVKDKPAAAQILATIFNLEKEEVLTAISNERLYLPPLVRGVPKEKRDEIVSQGFAGLLVEKRHERVYPENQLAAQLLGFVNREGAGNYGIEGYYDRELRGVSGSVVGEKDTLGRIISTLQKVAPEDGIDVELTLDHNVQFAVEERLYRGVEESGASGGQVVIMNPTSGEIIALGGTPSFDPNKFSEFASQPDRFRNPVIGTTYEPGSIFKPLIMASAIDLGKVEPDTTETFNKSVTVQGYEIHTALDKAYGNETMTQVLENSDNVGMVWVSGKMSNEELRNKLTSFGIDEKTGIDLAGEDAGLLLALPLWREIHRATIAFGQGVSVTPMQIVRAWAALINGGKLVTPHVVKAVTGERSITLAADAPIKEGVISQETSSKVRGMLESVVKNGPYGRTRIKGYRIGGKTGTAQIASDQGGYSETDYTHSLIGFFPVDEPKFLILVKLDKPKNAEFAESTAGPIFHDIAQYLFGYYKIPPTE